ncbi:related to Guanyl nucleotide exchange factor Sql2 [Melanopsichium pennsylvanicum]|uniref:Related to Guanyl nucleotide exchange factor Sql2 n=2 Tax=Melanopsichium pennsylvanicum TaxID=63383 RepID=A0AAJ4XLD4_9BASI|nr:related to Guanyl nucleotide exchange factor Sql2 [Melanopsichium pennsylvanicum 4]SNX83876.1 related to Guanyl nucleotide exchange factor Sql2 [Melanopsichium pennsylvanicum]
MASTSTAAFATDATHTQHRTSHARLAYPASAHDHNSTTEDDSEEPPSFFVRALYDFESNDSSSLSFQKGALIEVLTQLESGWWDGLIDNQVRGWFPSNYVEPISDQEAELELITRAQMHAQYSLGLSSHLSTASDSLSRLGFGAGFDGLHALFKGDGIGNSDAFSQLAEAAMLDPRRRMFDPVSPHINHTPVMHHTQASPHQQPAASLVNAAFTQTQFGTSGDPRTPATSAAAPLSEHQLALERARAATVSNPLEASSTASASLAAARPRASTSAHDNSLNDDVWIQKTSQRGQTVFYNIRTGAATSQMPANVSRSEVPQTSSNKLHPQPMVRAASSSQNSSSDSRKDPHDSNHLGPDRSRPTSLATSGESRPSSSNSSNTAIFHNGTAPVRAPSSNTADRMPDPTTAPNPWRLRLTDDEKYFFFVHRSTHEIRWNYTDAKTKLTILSNVTPRSRSPRDSVVPTSTGSEHSKGASSLGANLNMNQAVSSLNIDSDDSDIDGDMNPRLPGKPPRMDASRNGSTASSLAAFAHHPVLSPPKISPPTLLHEESAAHELQSGLTPAQVRPVSSLVRHANEVIRQLATIATEQIGTNGLAESDTTLRSPVDGGVYMPRLAHATAGVVAAIREVLYATGSLSLSSNDLASISKLVTIDAAEADANKALPEMPSGNTEMNLNLCSKVLQTFYSLNSAADAALLHPFGANLRDSLAPIPSGLHPLGRKLNAVVSKLVLSSRQVIDHKVTLASSPTSGMETTMTDLDADVFSKLYQCRQRLREDALELMRTLQSLSSEAEKSRSTALGAPHSRGWLRRVEASLESDLGLNGIGPTSFGSGMAAGWLGNGFVLPSKHEVALIKAESKVSKSSNPFDHRRDAESAIVRGLLTLRRIPEKRLDTPLIKQLHQILRQLDAAAGAKISSGVAVNALSSYGALETLIESIDLASGLDVDGPDPKKIKFSPINERNAANAVKARDLMRRFVALKQAAYDASCSLFMALQVESLASTAKLDSRSATVVNNPATRLAKLSATLVKTLEDLSKVGEEQLRDASPFLGARASVYGSEEGIIMPSTGIFSRKVNTVSNGLHEEVEEMARYGRINGDDPEEEAEFMYLGPGIAVPNGPRARSGSRATTGSTTDSPVTSLVPGRMGGGSTTASSSYRQRSTSVTTGGSARSMQSYTDSSGRILSRRGTLVDGHTAESIDEDGGESIRTGSGKLRRLLGDDAPLSHTLTHDSENSATTALIMAKRKEDEIPWFLEPDYMGDDIVIAQDGSVKGATLEALLARLTMHNSFDASFNNTFLMTYRSFTTTQTLLDLLAQRFKILPPQGLDEEELGLWAEKKQIPIRLRVFNVLKMWLEMHFYEGEDEPYLNQVRRFAVEEMGEAARMKAPSQHLQRLVERRQGEGEQMIRKMVLPNSAPTPILPKNLKKLKFLEIDPLELARQLTLLESRLYNKVKPAECLGLKWTKPGNDVHAKGIMESINTHNRISAWVAETILQQEDLKKRAALIKHFITIADRCRALNNFSGMWAIVSALSTAPVHRLRRTWDAVSQKHVVVFESLETLMSASRNWANYRETIHKLNPPCVPFLGRYLGDLTFIEDGNRDRLKENDQLINFGKRQKTAEVIREITIHQSTPYNLAVVPALEKFIESNLVDARSADDLYEQSLLLEPREREDEKIARLLQESGFL